MPDSPTYDDCKAETARGNDPINAVYARHNALDFAVRTYSHHGRVDIGEILGTADRYYEFVTGKSRSTNSYVIPFNRAKQELDRLLAEMGNTKSGTVRHSELYIAQQTLTWLTNPIHAAPPLMVILNSEPPPCNSG
jgi:hypothetical protein